MNVVYLSWDRLQTGRTVCRFYDRKWVLADWPLSASASQAASVATWWIEEGPLCAHSGS
jgi:hypothetical protein